MTTNFSYALKVTFDKSMNSLCCFNQNVFFYFDAIQNAYIANHLYKKLYGILYGPMCKLYDIIYAPQFLHEHKYNSKKEILLATCDT